MAVNFVLGIIDILAGIMIAAGGLPYLPGNGMVITIAVIVLLKGIWHLVSYASRGKGGRTFGEIFEGMLDVPAGLLLIWIFYGIHFPIAGLFGVLLIFKGAWYLLIGITE